jgi:acyl-CoA thioesterase
VVRGANGGYLAAITLRAMQAALASKERMPRSLTIHYCGAAQAGPLDIACKVERSGGSLSTLSARLEQAGRLVALALGAFSTPWRGALEYDRCPAPAMPAREAVEPLDDPGLPPFTRYFDYRFCLGQPPFSRSDEAETGGWLALRDHRKLDAPLIAAMGDAWLPAVLPMSSKQELLALPTIDYTVHFRNPAAESGQDNSAVKVLFTSRFSMEGFFEEDGLLWDKAGQLLAQTRQLALVLPATQRNAPDEERDGEPGIGDQRSCPSGSFAGGHR